MIKILELDASEIEDLVAATEDVPLIEGDSLTEAGEIYHRDAHGNLCGECSPTGETKFITLTHCQNCGVRL